MSEIKEVTVSLQPTDEKALARTTTRRRKTRKSDEITGNEIVALSKEMPLPTPQPQTVYHQSIVQSHPQPQQQSQSHPQPQQQSQSQSQPHPQPQTVYQPPIVQQPQPHPHIVAPVPAPQPAEIKIGGKKSGIPTQPPMPHKIIPRKKRILATAPITIKKPKFVVPAMKQPGDAVHENVRGKAKTRKFKERKISIEVRPAALTRKNRRHLKEKIQAMSISDVRRILLRKGIIKQKTSVPPEHIMRSMLQDYMLLHTMD